MKKKILLLLGIFSIGIVLYAQVGINTKNPQGVFHVDPKADTNGALGTLDDVVVTKSGNVGIGVNLPAHKVDIFSTTAGALQIEDPTAAVGKVLSSDANGLATWQNKLGGWYALLGGGRLAPSAALGIRKVPFSKSEISDPTLGAVSIANGSINVPHTGTYRLSVSGLYNCTRNLTAFDGYYLSVIIVSKNGNEIWRPHMFGHNSVGAIYVTYVCYVQLQQNDELALHNDERTVQYADYSGGLLDNENINFLVEFVK